MDILIITNVYPMVSNRYLNGFVHARALEYRKLGHNVRVLCSKLYQYFEGEYEYEGISVTSVKNLSDINLASFSEIDVVHVHFYTRQYEKFLFEISKPTLIFIHGVEALAWHRRLFNLKYHFFEDKSFKNRVRYIGKMLLDWYVKRRLSKSLYFLYEKLPYLMLVPVSLWMKKMAVSDVKLSEAFKFSVIPNYISGDIFPYVKKSSDLRFRVLVIRPFSTYKYATDIVVDAILYMHKKYPNYFNMMTFTIYGKGALFEKILHPLKELECDNIEMHNKFLNFCEISKVHQSHGVFLCPTRQDAQGVSMCEAMSSGLVPIASDNTAIPEFVKSNCGFLTQNYDEIVNAMIKIIDNPNMFLEMSSNASEYIREKCGINQTIMKELSLFNNA